ncbi:uncharacterized protein CEXT_194331 [Caerostris extrusa]|uniref:Uncharacterized protein n=1 Tax=Caerostris extrusa TaxID=172846 RepID=A0AAV4MM58_CAEEX|nr:uncharacterized protein CEXT_194331 [Caerostris extrusa]
MNFSHEDRKEVFIFLKEIIKSSYSEPVDYERIRGHVSRASETVKKYIHSKCKGEKFLDYFKRRKNYFVVIEHKISLKPKSYSMQEENASSGSSKKKKRKFVRRSISFTASSNSSSSKMNSNCHLDGEKEYEEISINYFRNKLIQKKKLRLAAIEFNELPKKIKRYIEFYYKSKVRNFLLNFPDKFIVDTDEDSVSLALQHYHHSNDDTVNLSEEKSSTDLIAEDNSDKGRSNLIESNNNSIKIDVEVQQALNYLNCIIFFVDVLKEINQPLLADKLGGYLSQAGSEIKEYIKLNYLKFKYFINDAPLIFLKNDLGELSLSKDYKNRIHFTKRIIYAAQAGSLPASELSLKSQINLILQPQIILSQEKQANKHIIDYFTETAKCKSIKESLNCFKSNSLSSDFDISEANQNINEEAHLILNYQFSNQDENEWDTTQNKKEMEFFCDALFKCFFTVQLYCLEFVESEMNFNKIYEYKAVKYFVKLLDTQSTKALRWTRLQGSLGNDTEIANFMNKMYKGDKFLSFFQNHPEFEISLPFIKLVFADILNTSDGLESFLPKKKILK